MFKSRVHPKSGHEQFRKYLVRADRELESAQNMLLAGSPERADMGKVREQITKLHEASKEN